MLALNTNQSISNITDRNLIHIYTIYLSVRDPIIKMGLGSYEPVLPHHIYVPIPNMSCRLFYDS